MLRFFAFLNIILLFASCVGEVPKLSPISMISTTFNPGNYSSFAGGVIIVGTDQSGNKIHKSFPNGVITPFPITRGDWKFYGVGYDGVSYVENSVTKIAQMEGAISCGTAELSVKLGKEATIDLNMTPGGCSGALYRDLKIQNVKVEPCSYFGVYDHPNNIFYPNATFGLNTCSTIPTDLWGSSTYYRIITLKNDNGVLSEGLKSRCTLSFLSDTAHMIPNATIPVKIKTYISPESCQADDYSHNEFLFSDGLNVQRPYDFDSELQEATSSLSVLHIPEALTKRYKSPFMNNVPRLLCKNGSGQFVDCYNSTYTSSRNITVDWNKPFKEKLLYSDAASNACETLATNSRYFRLSDCKIKNKFLYASVSRNKLSCLDSANSSSLTFKDIKYRNNKMYILYVKAGSSYVGIYDEGGQLLHEQPVGPSNTSFNALAVGKDNTFWVSNAASVAVIKYSPSGATFTATNALFGANGISAESLEVSEDGNYLFVGEQGTNEIIVYELSTGLMNQVDSITLSSLVRKLQFYDGKLYAHATNNPGVVNGTFYRIGFNAGELDILQSPAANTSKTFHIDKGYFITIGSGNEALVFPNMVSQGLMTGAYGTGVNTFAGNVDRLQIVNYKLYGFAYNTNSMLTIGWTPANWATGTWVTGAAIADTCSENFMIYENGKARATLTAATSKAFPDNNQKNRPVLEAASRFVGQRYLDFTKITDLKEVSEEQLRIATGGYLSQAQRILGTHGVGGMLYEFNDCNSIKTALLGGPIRRSYAVDDPYRGYQSYDIKIETNNDSVPSFICDDANFNTPCARQYDMKIAVSSTGLFEREGYRLKLKCDAKVGQLYYERNSGTSSAKEMYYWNTNDYEQRSRVDAYKMKKESGYTSYELGLLYKIYDDVRARNVQREDWTNYRRATINQYEIDDVIHSVRFEEVAGFTSGVPVGDPSAFSTANYDALKTQTDYVGPETGCLDRTAAPPSIDVAPCGKTLASIIIQNSKSIPLSLQSLEDPVAFENLFNSFP